MKIEISGTGCARCMQLYENSIAAASFFKDDSRFEIVKVGDVKYFARMGVFMTPGLIIDGELISTGKLLSPEEIRNKIEEKL
ncbi:MAG: thioredoxin family protein [Desulfatirhabdiaceae bacterium]